MRHENNHNVIYHYGMGHISYNEKDETKRSLLEEIRCFFVSLYKGQPTD